MNKREAIKCIEQMGEYERFVDEPISMTIIEIFVPFAAMSILRVDYTLEIIGNIYENPELVEGQS